MYGLLPFFVFWTIWGTELNLELYRGKAKCDGKEIDTGYPSLVFWLLTSYSLILCYFGLIVFGLNADYRSKAVRKAMFVLLRKMIQTEDSQTFHEIYDNAL